MRSLLFKTPPQSVAASQRQHHVEGGAGVDLGLLHREVVVEVVAEVDELLLRRVDPFLFLHQLLDAHDLVGGLDVDGDVAPGQGLDLDLHRW